MENVLKKARILIILVVFLLLIMNHIMFKAEALVPIEVVRTFSSSSYDGHTERGGFPTYSTVHDYSTGIPIYSDDHMLVGQRHSGSYYVIWRMYPIFNTSPLPDDCTIINATLQLYLYEDNSDDEFNITIQNGQPTYPHLPIAWADYGYTHYSGNGGTLDSSTFISGYNNVTFTSSGLDWISKTGYTKLCVRSHKDIASTPPSDSTNEWVSFWTAEKGDAYAPKLVVGYETEGYQYIFYGAYNEEALRDGAINCTVYKQTESPETFELDGSYTLSAELIPVAAHFDIGYNESRTFYIYLDFEEIYVVKPRDPYYTYFFTLIDYVGLEWGYLEVLINMNGTDRVIERQTIEILNDIPFTLSWGRAYKIRLICDQGEYLFGDFVAGATTTTPLVITKDMFPDPTTHTGEITVSARRIDASWIQCVYADANVSTNWVNFTFYEYGNATVFHYYYTTSNSITYNWYEGASRIHYYIIIIANHETFGMLNWSFACPAPALYEDNPFSALILLGDFPFDITQLPAVLIIIVVWAAFSWWNAAIGIISSVVTAFILRWLGWLATGWAWLSLSGCMCGLLAIAIMKERERTL